MLILGSGIARAEEKANITPPSGPKQSVETAPPANATGSFRPLDGNSSLGGVIDNGAPLPVVPPAAPNPRAQREFLERLDRQRNFLLIDPADDRSGTDIWLLEETTVGNNLPSSHRPQSLLERRWKGTSRTALVESPEKPDNQASRGSKGDTFFDDDISGSNQRKAASWGRNSTEGRQSSLLDGPHLSKPTSPEGSSALATLEDLRSELSTAAGRGMGLDPLTKERLERFKMSTADGASLRRGFSTEPSDFGQSRGLRSDSMDQLLASPPTPTVARPNLDSLMATPVDTGVIARSPKQDPAALGIIPNVYAPAVPNAPPPEAPALRFLKEPRPEPPRSRL